MGEHEKPMVTATVSVVFEDGQIDITPGEQGFFMTPESTWLAANPLITCARYRTRLTRDRCQEYRGLRPEACSGCDGPPESAYVKAARARGEKRKDYRACKGCGSRRKKVNQHGYCPTCNYRRFGGTT